MATILEELKQQKPVTNCDYLANLRSVGFIAPVAGFPKITMKAIGEYLEMLARRDAGAKKLRESEHYRWGLRELMSERGFFFPYSVGFGLCRRNWQMEWVERPLAKVKAMPPIHVLDSIKKAEKYFDRLRVVTVEKEESYQAEDPLVVGINKDDSDRYLIDWWDKDIDPSEIEMK